MWNYWIYVWKSIFPGICSLFSIYPLVSFHLYMRSTFAFFFSSNIPQKVQKPTIKSPSQTTIKIKNYSDFFFISAFNVIRKLILRLYFCMWLRLIFFSWHQSTPRMRVHWLRNNFKRNSIFENKENIDFNWACWPIQIYYLR